MPRPTCHTDEFLAIQNDYLKLQLEWAEAARDFYARKFDPSQPRVPSGSSTGGQWMRGGGAGRVGFARGLVGMIGGIVSLYNAMTKQNSRDYRAATIFKSKEYPIRNGQLALIEVRNLDRDETATNCPRFTEVQSRTDAAADAVLRRRSDLPPAEYGTAVHAGLKEQIIALGDPNFRAEVSYLKGDEEGYGKSGTIRIDVLERVDALTACVYDIKTGRSGLSVGRMNEIAFNVGKNFGAIGRVIVTEVRPSR